MTKARRKPHKPVDPWSGIDPENRPTKERMRHGGTIRTWLEPMRKGEHGPPLIRAKVDSMIEPGDIKEMGKGRVNAKAAFDHGPTPISRAASRRYITPLEKGAADRLERLTEVASLRPSTRDSLNMDPRGVGDMSDTHAERIASATQELRRARIQVNSWEWRAMQEVVIEHKHFGSYRGPRFLKCRSGLKKLAEWWKITA